MLQTRSIFEQFWCYALYNEGVDCLLDIDTQDGFWTDVYKQLCNYIGADAQNSFTLWFVADYHNLVNITYIED